MENCENNYQNDCVSSVKKENQIQVNTLANASFLLGVISIGCFIFLGIPFGLVISLFAITTGVISLIRKPKINAKKAILGIIFGAIVLTISIVLFIIIDPLMEFLKNYISSYCASNPESDECLLFEEMYPNFFNK